MKSLDWNDETMSIGITIIDKQHQELLKIINTLATTIEEDSQSEDILNIVNDLIDYAAYHFSTEETLFDRFNYIDTISHKKEHSDFVGKFIIIRNKLIEDETYKNSSAVEIAKEIFLFITNWFKNHVIGTDKKYVSLFKENGIG